jgi:hypothetical protein
MGYTASTAPTGWVFLDRHRGDGITIRWKRGDSVAYVLGGQRVGDHGMKEVLDTEAYAKPSLKKYRPIAARNEDKKVFSGLL